jgi:hypothetical protein
MRENRYFVRSTDVTNEVPVQIGDTPAILGYRTAIGQIEAVVGRDAASLFAEPVLPQGVASPATISWYCPFEGAAVEIGDIDEVARRPVVQKLAQRLEAFASALHDPAIGDTVRAWLHLSSPRDVLAVGGEPVLVNWGMVPREIAGDAALRAAHSARILGPYAPSLLAPAPAAPEPEPPADPHPRSPAVPPADPLATAPPASPPRRPWLAPSIATAAAAVVLAVLLIPGVLVYPDNANRVRDAFEEQRLRASNESLEAQLKALEGASRDRVCRAGDAPVPVPGLPRRDQVNGPPDAAEPTPPQMELVPRPPESVPVPRGGDANPTSATNVGELLDAATVLIVGLIPPKGSSQGTGFFISDRHIVTNHHVVQNVAADRIFVASRALGGIRHARLVAKSEPPPSEKDIRIDFAVLEIDPAANHPALKIGVTPPRLSTAYVAGFPGFITTRDVAFRNVITKLGESLRSGNVDEVLQREPVVAPGADLKYGRVNNIMNTGKAALPVVLHDMQLAPGNSGGPLVDACGRLGGVNTLLFRNDDGNQQANVAQDAALLRKFLADNSIAFTSDDSMCDPTRVAGSPPTPPAGAPPAATK